MCHIRSTADPSKPHPRFPCTSFIVRSAPTPTHAMAYGPFIGMTRAVKTVTWLANAMQQTVIEEPRVRGVVGGGGERAVTTFKPSPTFERAFKTGSSFKRAFTLRL